MTDSELLEKAWELLSPRLQEARRQRMEEVASKRSKRLRLVMQDIHDPHNVAACMRSAEGLGVLHVDSVNTYEEFAKPSTVARGSAHWLELSRHSSIDDYASEMKAQGYRLAAGYPGGDSVELDTIPIDEPVVFIFGNEHRGVHSAWTKHLDYRFTIPMVGMVESFNISVSAAITMYSFMQRSKMKLADRHYVCESEKMALLNKWVLRHSRNATEELRKLNERL